MVPPLRADLRPLLVRHTPAGGNRSFPSQGLPVWRVRNTPVTFLMRSESQLSYSGAENWNPSNKNQDKGIVTNMGGKESVPDAARYQRRRCGAQQGVDGLLLGAAPPAKCLPPPLGELIREPVYISVGLSLLRDF